MPAQVESPAARASQLTQAQRRQLLIDFNGKRVHYPRDKTVIDLFEAQVEQSPDRTALMSFQNELSYRELDAKANALAMDLDGLGVGRGDVVPIWTTKSPEFVICALALMKRGAVFVPLDIDWPQQRIRTILEDLQPRVVLTNQRQATAVAGPSRLWIVQAGELAATGRTTRERVSSLDPIYGFYTSGSTGMPKCAINLHRGLVNRFCYMTRRFGIRENDVILQNTQNAFDSSMWQLFWPLLNGARVVIPAAKQRYDLMETIDVIHHYRITLTDLVPSVFNVLVHYLRANPEARPRLKSLRQLLVGGEEMNAKATHEFKSMLPHVGITNTYGPTETSIGVVFYEVPDERLDRMPIGRPIDNTCILILDENMNPVPLGSTGEIYIGGDCVGRGYLNDEARTRSVFVPNPFEEVHGDILYRTGDFAYHLPDGNIQFVGRRDQQVQLGGVRVELGEIECALLRCPAVKEAKVLLTAGPAGREELAACVVPQEGFNVLDAKNHLREHLSECMIPRRFEVFDVMPLNHNGKVDRELLLRRLQARAVQAGPHPSQDSIESPDETFVIEACRELLGCDRASTAGSFVELGGDSLLAIQLISRVKEACGVSLSLQDVFEPPDLRSLGRTVADRRRGRAHACRGDGDALQIPHDLVLDDGIRRPPREHEDCRFQKVLLTGATGFVGAHLLHRILSSTAATVHCLVRAPDERAAIHRIKDSLARYRLSDEDLNTRVVPIPGDLSAPWLGIGEPHFESLAGGIDSIIHNGAMVNFARGYNEHRPPNVLGTKEILRLASTGRPKRVHHISTLSILTQRETDRRHHAPEDQACCGHSGMPGDGYSRSKWVAEKLLETARNRGITANIYRLGEVMPHTRHGVPNARALSHLLIKHCLALGLYPQSNAVIDYSPADYVSATIVHFAQRQEWANTTFHVCHPTGVSLGQLMRRLASPGLVLQEVPYADFRRQLIRVCAGGRENRELASLMFLLDQAEGENDARSGRDAATEGLSRCFQALPACVDGARSVHALDGSSIRCPTIDHEILRPYADYCLSSVNRT